VISWKLVLLKGSNMQQFVQEHITAAIVIVLIWVFIGANVLWVKKKLTHYFDKKLEDKQLLLFILSFLLMVFWPVIWLIEKRIFRTTIHVEVKP
jgi:hypothetical protein